MSNSAWAAAISAAVSARAARARLSAQHSDLITVRFAYSNPAVLSRGEEPALLPKRSQSLLPGDAGSVSATEMRVQPVKTRERRLGGQSLGLCLWGCACICAKEENKHTAGPHVCCVRKRGFEVGKWCFLNSNLYHLAEWRCVGCKQKILPRLTFPPSFLRYLYCSVGDDYLKEIKLKSKGNERGQLNTGNSWRSPTTL